MGYQCKAVEKKVPLCESKNKYNSPNNSHSYSKWHVQYIMEPQYRSVSTESMWWTQSGILFCFLCLLKTSRHFFCVNGTFECVPHNAVPHLLWTYSIWQWMLCLSYLGDCFKSCICWSYLAVQGLQHFHYIELGSTENGSYDQKPLLSLQKPNIRITQRSAHLSSRYNQPGLFLHVQTTSIFICVEPERSVYTDNVHRIIGN